MRREGQTLNLKTLPAKEVVRTSILSSDWRCMWTTCPKLSFGVNMCSHSYRWRKRPTQMFIDGVNAVLQKHQAKVVDNLEIKFEFESKLIDHLNNWISYAMSSRTKNLALDLAPPKNYGERDDRYIFPFELLDSESVSCLQCLQLSFVSFKPPSEFIGFPNLRKLYLHLVHATNKDLEDIVSSCCNLEWLSIVRCHLRDELKVVQPLSQLQYLQVIYCQITKIEFHAVKLSTFVYYGRCIPIALHHSSKLENAHVWFSSTTFQHVAAVLLNGLPVVQNLTLKFSLVHLETKWMLDSPHMFSQLRHLQLPVLISNEDTDKILYLASVLRVAPFIEKLEVHQERTSAGGGVAGGRGGLAGRQCTKLERAAAEEDVQSQSKQHKWWSSLALFLSRPPATNLEL